MGGEGVLKSLFKAIKSLACGQGLARVFMTSVSPVVMSDIGSGYNTIKTLSDRPEYRDQPGGEYPHRPTGRPLRCRGHAECSQGRYSGRDLPRLAALHLGVLTLAGRNERGKLRLVIPNLWCAASMPKDCRTPSCRSTSIGNSGGRRRITIYAYADLAPLCDFIDQQFFKVFDNRDLRSSNGLTVKNAFLTLLFNDTFYNHGLRNRHPPGVCRSQSVSKNSRSSRGGSPIAVRQGGEGQKIGECSELHDAIFGLSQHRQAQSGGRRSRPGIF
uniref:Predicted AAA-ATPase n=1 Tax=Candidatus Kentrum eta TaxID=2126337 RepID=A0A450VD26_9GAMM|nr:MAG: Predicted AAA-ATPase [Candidatus Kentron sp. H]